MCRRVIYPYEWVDDIEKLKNNGLPELRDFYSTLKLQGVSESEYEHAWNVYNKLKCKTFEDYHNAFFLKKIRCSFIG
jgi:hypothetical protein